jgi:hypothetical protein
VTRDGPLGMTSMRQYRKVAHNYLIPRGASRECSTPKIRAGKATADHRDHTTGQVLLRLGSRGYPVEPAPAAHPPSRQRSTPQAISSALIIFVPSGCSMTMREYDIVGSCLVTAKRDFEVPHSSLRAQGLRPGIGKLPNAHNILRESSRAMARLAKFSTCSFEKTKP